jgi:hypothetical protein
MKRYDNDVGGRNRFAFANDDRPSNGSLNSLAKGRRSSDRNRGQCDHKQDLRTSRPAEYLAHSHEATARTQRFSATACPRATGTDRCQIPHQSSMRIDIHAWGRG